MASFISIEEFNASLNEKTELTMQWSELPINIIYKIKHIKEVLFENTATMILDLVDDLGHTWRVWTPQRIYMELLRFSDKANIYIRSLGKKECKMTTGRWYYDYNLAQISN